MVTAIVTILIFLVLITLHEFGHFIMAKLSGVPVLEFAIGMGPAIFKKQGKETLYSFRIFPVGGYCKLEGEDEETESPNSFSKQKLWKRFLVVSAGAILNLVLGFLVFGIIVAMTGPVATNVVDDIDQRTYLAKADIRSGDEITRINGHKINFFQDISLYTDEFEAGKEITITVKRDGEKFDVAFLPSESMTEVTYEKNLANYTTIVNGVKETQSVKLQEGDVPEEYIGKTFTENGYIMGFTVRQDDVTALNIVPQAWNYTVFVGKTVFMALGDMITGKVGLDAVSGPVGVATVVNSAVNSGSRSLENILFILAMLSVNLGIFNLLPLPALDGGRLFFMLIELVRGKPIPPEKEGIVHTVGLVLLLVLAGVVFFNDILKLF